MEEKHNPNSQKRLRRDSSHSWSELPLDLLNLVFQRLNFANFQRAKSVCSSWYSASRQYMTKTQIPWLILFPKDENNNSCTLLNPEEKHKRYKTQDLCVEFAKCVCIATYGSWLLMQDSKCNLNILNPFTRERINLPPAESQRGKVKIKRIIDNRFRISHYHLGSESKDMSIGSPVFWIDEKTKDYVVFWGLRDWCVVSAEKGDTSWNQIPNTSNCCNMVYKDHKLYFLTNSGGFKILDFSGEIPQQIFKCGTFLKKFKIRPPSPSSWKQNNKLGGCHRQRPSDSWFFFDPKLVVTVRGDVLRVIMKQHRSEYIWSFDVKYIYSSSGNLKKYEKVDSLGDEAMLLDLGITVPSSEIDGLNGNSIYFSGSHGRRKTNGFLIFDLETEKLEKLHKYDCSSV